MPRIRTIKPEFFRSPSTAKVDHTTRIFYQALWCWADDFGIGETNIHGLLGFAFPDDDQIYDPALRTFRAVSAQDLRRFCADCAQHFDVAFYIVRERHYYAIPSWDDHQKTERRTERRRNPTPDDPDAMPDLRFHGCAETAQNCAELPAQNQRKNSAGTGEQGNRGTDTRSPRIEPAANRLIKEHIPKTHPETVKTELRLQAGQLLSTGQPEQLVIEALKLWTRKKVHPKTLPSLVSEVINSRTTATTGMSVVDTKVSDWLQLADQQPPSLKAIGE